MELICKECHEVVERGTPRDAKPIMPTDRKFYRHTRGKTALCPTVGLDANGDSSYIPCLPIKK
mgnify:FL=1